MNLKKARQQVKKRERPTHITAKRLLISAFSKMLGAIGFSHGHDIVPGRKFYLPGEASDVMNSTRQFMQHLAIRLEEKT